jgi:hypothetical protein
LLHLPGLAQFVAGLVIGLVILFVAAERETGRLLPVAEHRG